MSKPKINVFGNIFEDSDGVLNFNGFNIDGDFSNKSSYVIILELCIQRLQDSLEKQLENETKNLSVTIERRKK